MWTQWTSCSCTCSNGDQTRIRTCVGVIGLCPGNDKRTCNKGLCNASFYIKCWIMLQFSCKLERSNTAIDYMSYPLWKSISWKMFGFRKSAKFEHNFRNLLYSLLQSGNLETYTPLLLYTEPHQTPSTCDTMYI